MTASEKLVEERDAVMRERKAAAYGFTCAALRCGTDRLLVTGGRVQIDIDAEAFAKERFPLPKLKRPRVVRSPDNAHYELRYVEGRVEERFKGGTWTLARGWDLTDRMLDTFADLRANPTEEVESE